MPLQSLPYYWVDAFTSKLFAGNPAAVCPLLGEWPEDSLLQSIAFENNSGRDGVLSADERWPIPSPLVHSGS